MLPVDSPQTRAPAFRKLEASIRSYCRSKVRPEEVDDLVQDILVKIVTQKQSLREAEKADAWLRTLVRNQVIDHYRKHRRPSAKNAVSEYGAHRPAEDQRHPRAVDRSELYADTDEDKRIEASELNTMVAGWLRPFASTLPSHYAQALIWADFEGIPQKEVASRLGLSLSGAKSRIQRARILLKNSLLACCAIEHDRFGNVIDIKPKSACGCTDHDSSGACPQV